MRRNTNQILGVKRLNSCDTRASHNEKFKEFDSLALNGKFLRQNTQGVHPFALSVIQKNQQIRVDLQKFLKSVYAHCS